MSAPEGYVEGFICTLATCSVKDWGFVKYQPTIPGNSIFLAIIVIIAIAQIYLGIKYRTPVITSLMCTGLLIESAGYVARILMHENPFSRDYFLIYLICLTLGPVFFAAAIYLCIGRIVVVYGENSSLLKPKTYTIFFVACDIVSLVVQGVGGGIAASYPLSNQYMIDLGTNILVAGLAFQVASLFAFSVCFSLILFHVKKNKHSLNSEFPHLHQSTKYKTFLAGLGLATACIFIRSVFRSVELSEGFSGHLANNEISFMILDGVMVLVACITVTAVHPGISFGRDNWVKSGFSFGKERIMAVDSETCSPSSEEKVVSKVVEKERGV